MKVLLYITLITVIGWSGVVHAEWEEVSDMNVARRSHAAVAAEGKIYVFGGLSARGRMPVATAECYDPETGDWEMIEPLPAPLSQMVAVYNDTYIYIFGGEHYRGEISATVLRYDIEEDEYTTVARMPNGLRGLGAVPFSDNIVLMGGIDLDGGYSESCYSFSPANNRIREFPAINEPRIHFGYTTLDSDIWVVGGLFHGPLTSIERYDGRAWRAVARMPIGRVGLAASFLDGFLIVTGGATAREQASQTVMAFHPRSQSWDRIDDMHRSRIDHAMVKLDDGLYVIGGGSLNDHQMHEAIRSVERLSEVVSVSDDLIPSVYPPPQLITQNPVNGPVIFKLNGRPAKISIVDMLGRPVASNRFGADSYAWTWDSSSYPNGAYIYRIISPDHDITSGRIIVIK